MLMHMQVTYKQLGRKIAALVAYEWVIYFELRLALAFIYHLLNFSKLYGLLSEKLAELVVSTRIFTDLFFKHLSYFSVVIYLVNL